MYILLLHVGAGYGRAESSLKDFIEQTNIPFLPTPMGKGVLPDAHSQCVAPARSRSVTEIIQNNPYPADHDYCSLQSLFLVDQIHVIGNDMCV